jgi:hypothetical protein
MEHVSSLDLRFATLSHQPKRFCEGEAATVVNG